MTADEEIIASELGAASRRIQEVAV
jgi:hypothetical protein